MKEKDKQTPEIQEENDKIHVSQSVFQTARELQQQQFAEMEEQQRILQQKAAEREKKKREAYERRLLEEKKELIRLKQGTLEQSEMIREEAPVAVKLTPWQNVKNFFYHNKWWLGFGVLIAAIFIYLIYDVATKERPDLIVLVIAENAEVGTSEGLEEYIAQFTEDFNDNGEVLVSVYHIPYTDNAQKNYANGVDTKLTAELQSADALMIIGGEKITEILKPENSLVNLEEMYPDNPYVKEYGLYLKDTSFAEKTGISEASVTDDLFIAIRKPQKLLYTDMEEMQEAYDETLPIFQQIVDDLSK